MKKLLWYNPLMYLLFTLLVFTSCDNDDSNIQSVTKELLATASTDKTVANAVERLNNRPRKCLKYQTPHEVFFERLTVALEM